MIALRAGAETFTEEIYNNNNNIGVQNSCSVATAHVQNMYSLGTCSNSFCIFLQVISGEAGEHSVFIFARGSETDPA